MNRPKISMDNMEESKGEVAELIERGENCYKQGKYAEALESFDKALEKDPDNDELLLNRGEALSARGYALIKLGRNKEAIDSFDRAVEESPDSANM